MNKLVKRLIEAVRIINGRKEYRLHFYKGDIRPDVIDTNAANVLGQALISSPEQIHLVADIKLSTKNNLLPIDTPDYAIRDQINPILSTVINYLRYFFINNHYRRKGGRKCRNPILKTYCLTSQKELRTFRRLRL